jgi:hypothetical protein
VSLIRVFKISALNPLHEKQNQKLDQYINQINTDTSLKHKIETINLLLTKSTTESIIDYYQIELLIIELKRFIGHSVNYWNAKMSDFLKKPRNDTV